MELMIVGLAGGLIALVVVILKSSTEETSRQKILEETKAKRVSDLEAEASRKDLELKKAMDERQRLEDEFFKAKDELEIFRKENTELAAKAKQLDKMKEELAQVKTEAKQKEMLTSQEMTARQKLQGELSLREIELEKQGKEIQDLKAQLATKTQMHEGLKGQFSELEAEVLRLREDLIKRGEAASRAAKPPAEPEPKKVSPPDHQGAPLSKAPAVDAAAAPKAPLAEGAAPGTENKEKAVLSAPAVPAMPHVEIVEPLGLAAPGGRAEDPSRAESKAPSSPGLKPGDFREGFKKEPEGAAPAKEILPAAPSPSALPKATAPIEKAPAEMKPIEKAPADMKPVEKNVPDVKKEPPAAPPQVLSASKADEKEKEKSPVPSDTDFLKVAPSPAKPKEAAPDLTEGAFKFTPPSPAPAPAGQPPAMSKPEDKPLSSFTNVNKPAPEPPKEPSQQEPEKKPQDKAKIKRETLIPGFHPKPSQLEPPA